MLRLILHFSCPTPRISQFSRVLVPLVENGIRNHDLSNSTHPVSCAIVSKPSQKKEIRNTCARVCVRMCVSQIYTYAYSFIYLYWKPWVYTNTSNNTEFIVASPFTSLSLLSLTMRKLGFSMFNIFIYLLDPLGYNPILPACHSAQPPLMAFLLTRPYSVGFM